MSGVYTFGEVIKVLGITSGELNELMASRKLTPVRHEGRLKFKQEDVENLKNIKNNAHMLSHDQSQSKKYYTWDEVLTKLQIEKEELERFIEDGDIQVHKEGSDIKFSCEEVDSFVNNIMDQGTIVMSNNDVPVMVEDYDVVAVNVPIPSIPKVPKIETYSLEKTLIELQTEESHLQKLVDEGDIETVSVDGEIRYSKADIDSRRQNLQVEATIVMPQQDIIVEEDDEPLEPIVISAPKIQEDINIYDDNNNDGDSNDTPEPMVILPEETRPETISQLDSVESKKKSSGKKEYTKSFYTLSEVAQELNVNANTLLELLEKNKIKTYRMNKLKNIKRSDLLKLSSMQFVQNSMQMIKSQQEQNVEEDDDEEAEAAIPIADITKEISPPTRPKYENTIVIPLVDEIENDSIKKIKASTKVSSLPQSQTKDKSCYYSFVEALNVLQMEQEGLNELLNNKNLNYCLIDGVKSLLKNEVNEYKANKMVEPTIMMDESGDDVLEEDDDEGLFFIS